MNKQELEKVLKEWETLGYESNKALIKGKNKYGTNILLIREERKNNDIIYFHHQIAVEEKIIISYCSINEKYVSAFSNNSYPFIISFEVHKLLNKTFKALGWLEYEIK